MVLYQRDSKILEYWDTTSLNRFSNTRYQKSAMETNSFNLRFIIIKRNHPTSVCRARIPLSRSQFFLIKSIFLLSYIYIFQLMIGLDPWNILSWKKYIFKHLKCIFKLKKSWKYYWYIYIYFSCLFVCLFVTDKRQNRWTDWAFFVGPHISLGKVYEYSELHIMSPKLFDFPKYL